MNILFFSGKIIYGGGEKVRNWLANRLIGSGHIVYYATPTINDDYIKDLEKVSLLNKVKIIEYPFDKKNKSPFFYYRSITSLFKSNKIDLLIIFGGSLVEQVIAKRNGVKILLSERCDPASRPILSRILKQIQYRIADGYVFQTPEASLCYCKRAKKISTVIPNPIIDHLDEPQYKEYRNEIVTVGRLSPEKNQELLIDAFYLVHKKEPKYKLVIYGSGPLKEKLCSKIESLHLQDSVSIVSGKNNISELIVGSELFVLPSNTEGMPNALIEAMSVGLLCISADCPIYGPRMLVRNGENGFLFPIKDKTALYNTMLNAINLNSSEKEKIRKSATDIRETLQEDKIFDRWNEYISSMFK